MDCRVVLVRPRDPNNIGAAARAMKNFGFRDLAVVAPYPPIWDEAVSAVNAVDLLRSARVVESLAGAIEDRTLVVGTVDPTRQTGQPFWPRDLADLAGGSDHRLAIVFGAEKHGLTNDDLSHCHRVMSIPTQPDCPSMNLGQAVAVCCYELASTHPVPDALKTPSDAAPTGKIEIALQLTLDVLAKSGYILPGAEAGLAQKLRCSLLRFSMTEHEVDRLCGALRKIGDSLRQ